MKEYPETLQEFMDMFGTEDACRQYLARLRWDSAFRCSSCAHTTAWRVRRSILRCKGCHRDVSVTAGTIFHRSRIPLRLWFQALWLVVSQKQGVSALGLSRSLGITRQKTGWHLLFRIRTAMVRPGRDRLSGTVEVDEVFLGGVKPGIGGRGAGGKVLILIAAEDTDHGIGRVRIRVIPDASYRSISMALAEMVEPGSLVRTDKWQGYAGIEKKGYRHRTVDRRTAVSEDNLTPLVHRVASLLKRWLLGTHQGGIQAPHLQLYLDEFVFRFNRRTSRSRGKLFFRLLQNIVQVHV